MHSVHVSGFCGQFFVEPWDRWPRSWVAQGLWTTDDRANSIPATILEMSLPRRRPATLASSVYTLVSFVPALFKIKLDNNHKKQTRKSDFSLWCMRVVVALSASVNLMWHKTRKRPHPPGFFFFLKHKPVRVSATLHFGGGGNVVLASAGGRGWYSGRRSRGGRRSRPR